MARVDEGKAIGDQIRGIGQRKRDDAEEVDKVEVALGSG